MKVFISWSGAKSKRIATALKLFLNDLNDRIEPWFSGEDIHAGQRWLDELSSKLENNHFGIICITKESLNSPWVIFESGALSKSIKDGKVCPYLIDLDREQIKGPLSQFQAIEANKEQTLQMLQSINSGMGPVEALSDEQLKRRFEKSWPDLLEVITKANNELLLPKVEGSDEPNFFDSSDDFPPKGWLKLLQDTNGKFDIMGISHRS